MISVRPGIQKLDCTDKGTGPLWADYASIQEEKEAVLLPLSILWGCNGVAEGVGI